MYRQLRVYILLGTLPIEAELHRKQLSLPHSILRGENRTLLDILERRLLPMNYNQESFFCKSQNLLNLYNLPNVETLKILLPTKLEWKRHVKQAIDQKWYKSLQDEAASKSSMIYCNTNDLKPSTPHQVWKTLDTSMSEIKKAVTKVRMLTGSYILYGRQWQTEEQNLCKLCYLEQEDVKHILTRCTLLSDIRNKYVKELKAIIDSDLGILFWKTNIKTKTDLTKLILDCSFFIIDIYKNEKYRLLSKIEATTRKLCHYIHSRRLDIIKEKLSAE